MYIQDLALTYKDGYTIKPNQTRNAYYVQLKNNINFFNDCTELILLTRKQNNHIVVVGGLGVNFNLSILF